MRSLRDARWGVGEFVGLVFVLTCGWFGWAGPAWAGITYDQVILGDNPTAYWRFEESSTSQPAADWATADGAQNGVYTGTASLGPGIVGGALYVTPGGTEGGYVRADNVNITRAFTFEAWVRSETSNWNTWGWIASA